MLLFVGDVLTLVYHFLMPNMNYSVYWTEQVLERQCTTRLKTKWKQINYRFSAWLKVVSNETCIDISHIYKFTTSVVHHICNTINIICKHDYLILYHRIYKSNMMDLDTCVMGYFKTDWNCASSPLYVSQQAGDMHRRNSRLSSSQWLSSRTNKSHMFTSTWIMLTLLGYIQNTSLNVLIICVNFR